MVSEIYIYIEGGGDKKFGKTKIREGFHKFTQAWGRFFCLHFLHLMMREEGFQGLTPTYNLSSY